MASSPSSPSANHKVAVVTGSSTGIGYETSLILARNGFLTYATMRNLNKSENIKMVVAKENLPIQIKQLDVTQDVSVKNAIRSISSEAGRIDVLVNNAGYGLNGAFEDLAMDEINQCVWVDKDNSGSSSNYEKTGIGNHRKY